MKGCFTEPTLVLIFYVTLMQWPLEAAQVWDINSFRGLELLYYNEPFCFSLCNKLHPLQLSGLFAFLWSWIVRYTHNPNWCLNNSVHNRDWGKKCCQMSFQTAIRTPHPSGTQVISVLLLSLSEMGVTQRGWKL